MDNISDVNKAFVDALSKDFIQDSNNVVEYCKLKLNTGIFIPTMELRWIVTKCNGEVSEPSKILQQKWQGQHGDEEWRNVQVEIIE